MLQLVLGGGRLFGRCSGGRVHALEEDGHKDFVLTDYRSHALRDGSSSDAAAYVQLKHEDGRLVWGAGVDPSIEMAGLKALVSAWNLLR